MGNWANLSTPLGLLIAKIGGSRLRRGPRGLILAEGYRLAFPIAGAFTVGNVVITAHPSWSAQESSRPGMLDHEENHSWQWTYCVGLPFLPLYVAAMGWSWLRTGDRSSANVFEREADLTLGGYQERELRPLSEGLRQVRTQLAGFSRAKANSFSE